MNESTRQEILRRWHGGASLRQIAHDLGLARNTVHRALADVQDRRAGTPTPAARRPSLLDPFVGLIEELLSRYPDLTATRLLEELRRRGFTGGYTIVRAYWRRLRPRGAPPPVIRFETAPGAQAQMDYGVYDLALGGAGRRRVYLFSYLLGYSRRQYLRFVNAQDFPTTLREHVRAFE
jgi:transposase